MLDCRAERARPVCTQQFAAQRPRYLRVKTMKVTERYQSPPRAREIVHDVQVVQVMIGAPLLPIQNLKEQREHCFRK